MTDCIQDEAIEGALGDYLYAWKNGQQILIGSRQQEGALPDDSVVVTTSFVFMSKDDGRQQRRPTTWNDLRALLAEGWVVGTDKKPGVKAWYPKTGRSIRRQLQDIYVFCEPRPTGSGDSIRIGSISNNAGAIAVGRGARATVINQVVQGLGYLQTQHEASVRNFLDYYVGTSDSPEPFGGREPNLAAYTRWLDDPTAPPYALLTAPAGMGKSAVLAHWVAQLQQRRDIAVVYFPISERFETNAKSVVFSALYARVAHLLGVQPTRLFSAEEYRGAFQDYLTHPLPDGRRLLVVLDGLDEASGWEVGAGLFPTQAPSHLKVMVAAREIAGDLDWAARLGWRVPAEAAVFGLRGLSRAELEEVFLSMGDPLSGLRANFDIVEKLHELTDHGDPLMIRLYVDALRRDKDSAPDFRPEDLLKLQPGLGRFFEYWFAQQENLWRANGDYIDRQAVDTLLHARAMAHGPLTADDLDALAHDTFHGTSGARRVANALRRFLVGSGARGSGYSFSHPRLTQHFREQLANRERKDWVTRYQEYGASTLRELESGVTQPGSASEYIIRNYRLHLEAQPGSPASLSALMSRGWLMAWRALEGTEEGFLDDVQAAVERAATAGPAWLGQVIRGTLCFSSVASLTVRLEPKLIAFAIAHAVIDSRVGMAFARANLQVDNRVESLLVIAETNDEALARVARYEAMSTIWRMEKNDKWRTLLLRMVVGRLSTPTVELLGEALAIARETEDHDERAKVLVAVVKRTPSDALALFEETMSIARGIVDVGAYSTALREIALCLPVRADTLWRALSNMARGIPYGSIRADVLTVMSDTRQGPERNELLDEALSIARELEDDEQKIVAYCSIAERSPDAKKRTLLSEALNLADQIQSENSRANALAAVAKALTDGVSDLRPNVLYEARELKSEAAITKVYSAVAKQLSASAPDVLAILIKASRFGEAYGDNLNTVKTVADQLVLGAEGWWVEALTAVRNVRFGDQRAELLCQLAVHTPPTEAKKAIGEALTTARDIRDPRERAESLCKIATKLPSDEAKSVFSEALSAARLIGDERDLWRALEELIPRVPVDLLGALLEMVSRLRGHMGHPWLLFAIADRFPREQAFPIACEAWVSAQGIGDDAERMIAFSTIARYSSTEKQSILVNGVMMQVGGLRHEWDRASVLCGVLGSPLLTTTAIRAQALTIAREMQDEQPRASVLHAVVRCAPLTETDIWTRSLTMAREFGDNRERIEALTAMIARLPENANELLALMLATARRSEDERLLAEALKNIVELLPQAVPELLAEILQAVRGFRGEAFRVEVLGAIAGRISPNSPELMAAALQIARETRSELGRAESLSIVAAHCPDDQLALVEEALDLACAIDDPYNRALALIEVTRHLPTDSTLLFGKALAAAREISSEVHRTQMVSVLIERLPIDSGALMDDIVKVVFEIKNETDQAQAVGTLVRQIAREIADGRRMGGLELNARLLALARDIKDEGERVSALAAMAGILSAEQASMVFDEALRVAYEIQDTDQRIAALSLVGHLLPPHVAWPVLRDALGVARTREALEVTRSPRDNKYLKYLQQELARINQTLIENNTYVPLWLSSALNPPLRFPRREILQMLEDLIPAVASVDDGTALQTLLLSIRDTAEWWP